MNNTFKVNNEKEEKTHQFLKKIVELVKILVNDERMINKCDLCQEIIGKYFEKVGIEYYPCSTHKVITTNITGHSFIVAVINKKYYLIDPSFIQFKYDDNEEVIINGIKCISKTPYYYLELINNDLKNKLINDGYFELDEKSAYEYGNAFYFTKVSIPQEIKLNPISGNILLKSFKTGNDKLSNYNIGEIENNSIYRDNKKTVEK